MTRRSPPFDPRFQPVFDKVSGYLNDPATLACVSTQPELCANAGYAPRNTAGSLTLFGDVERQGRRRRGCPAVVRARRWRSPAGNPPYRFLSAIQERVATVDQRVDLFRDADPANDPTIIGARSEACAVCHTR